jgi:hypothetical protein
VSIFKRKCVQLNKNIRWMIYFFSLVVLSFTQENILSRSLSLEFLTFFHQRDHFKSLLTNKFHIQLFSSLTYLFAQRNDNDEILFIAFLIIWRFWLLDFWENKMKKEALKQWKKLRLFKMKIKNKKKDRQ